MGEGVKSKKFWGGGWAVGLESQGHETAAGKVWWLGVGEYWSLNTSRAAGRKDFLKAWGMG